MKIKQIFFDFDGVIKESVNVKSEAFYDLYLPYGEEVAKKVLKHHFDNGGMSRFDKFRYYHSEFLKKPITEDEVNNLANQFSLMVFDKVVQCPYVKGVEQFLRENHQDMVFWIISGTPTEELKKIIDKLGMSNWFKGVYGSPEKKDFWSQKILDETDISADQTVFIGDATSDYNAAKATGTHFILRSTKDNGDLFKDYTGARIFDFNEIHSVMETFV